jgi:putative toxin-antitoxin system antitoxin component (TIGR02293 family)
MSRRKQGEDATGADAEGGALPRILARAMEVFGTRENAEEWLSMPAMALDQRHPIDLLSSPAGAGLVNDLLTRLEFGVFA